MAASTAALVGHYLDRLGISRTEPTLELLDTLLERHVATFPYETLGLALGQDYALEPDACLTRCLAGRPGYCYTQNLAFTTVLEAVGFDVRRHLGDVTGRTKPEPTAITGGHMAVTVVVDGVEHLADAGLGPGPVRSTPLAEGPFTQGPFTHRLQRSPVPGGAWRLVLDPAVGGFRTMDFSDDIAAWQDFVPRHEQRRHIGQPGRPYFQAMRPRLDAVEMVVGIRHSVSPGAVEVLDSLPAWRSCVEALGCTVLDHADSDDVAALHTRLVGEHAAFAAAEAARPGSPA